MAVVPFAPWEPDAADLNANVSSDVMNVLCAGASYLPFPSLSTLTAALPAPPLGDFMAKELNGTVTIFAGTADKLFRLNANTMAWDDVSQEDLTYSATPEAPWSFAQFGNFVIAVNANNDPQVFELGGAVEFSDLPGDPPRAAVAKVWGDFLCLMGLTSNPDRVHWSGLNNIEQWTPGVENCDYQTFPDGGPVKGSTESTNPIIFQERAIRVATFIPGSSEIFSFQKLHDQRGAKSAASIASRGAYTFYADEGGFFQIGSDGSIVDIGFEKVDRTVFGGLAASDISEIRGVVDPFFSRVYFAADFKGAGHFDRLLIYDWNLQRWSQASIAIRSHLAAATLGFTLESLDDVSSSLEDLPFSLDSKVWQGGAPVLAAFGLDNKMGFFSGPALEATLTTQEMGDVEGAMTAIRSIYPVVDTANVRVSIGSRFRRSDPVVWSSEAAPSSNTGTVYKRARARFHRARVRLPANGDWTQAQGVTIDSVGAGRR